MLNAVLPYCKEIGLEKILISCIDGNIGSEKAILNNGGVYESTVYEPRRKFRMKRHKLKRFWICGRKVNKWLTFYLKDMK